MHSFVWFCFAAVIWPDVSALLLQIVTVVIGSRVPIGTGAPSRQLFCGPQLGSVHRWLLCLHSQGRQLPHGAVNLLQDQCRGDWSGRNFNPFLEKHTICILCLQAPSKG